MKTLNFSYNWNAKLFCDCFSTIRLSDFYQIDEEVIIQLQKNTLDTGKIVSKVETKLNKLTEYVCRIDTGYGLEETKGIIKAMFPGITDWENQKIYLYTITRKYREKTTGVTEAFINEKRKLLTGNKLTTPLKDLLLEEVYVHEVNEELGINE